MRTLISITILGAVILSCSSGSRMIENQADTPLAVEENLGTETGLVNKRTKIQKLQDELMDIDMQIQERQRLLDELSNIKQVIDTDTLVEEGFTD